MQAGLQCDIAKSDGLAVQTPTTTTTSNNSNSGSNSNTTSQPAQSGEEQIVTGSGTGDGSGRDSSYIGGKHRLKIYGHKCDYRKIYG